MDTGKVRSKLDVFTAADPLVSTRALDPWADFRQVEKIELHWSQTYKHSLGKYSRFFLELEQGRLFATRCDYCQTVWLPPRPACANDLRVTHWVELSGHGTLEGFSVLDSAPAFIDEKAPYVLAYVRLDGASTLFPHVLRNYGPPDNVRKGMRVKVVYGTEPVDHPIRLMWYEPE